MLADSEVIRSIAIVTENGERERDIMMTKAVREKRVRRWTKNNPEIQAIANAQVKNSASAEIGQTVAILEQIQMKSH